MFQIDISLVLVLVCVVVVVAVVVGVVVVLVLYLVVTEVVVLKLFYNDAYVYLLNLPQICNRITNAINSKLITSTTVGPL